MAAWLFKTPLALPRPPEYFAEFLAGQHAIAFVADVGQVVGVALGLMRETPSSAVFRRDRFGVIDSIAIERSWRRHGAGTRLARAVEDWAIARGAAWVELNVYRANQEALRFYEKLGFLAFSSTLRMVPGSTPGSAAEP